jgi:hypothetical protein
MRKLSAPDMRHYQAFIRPAELTRLRLLLS